MTEAQKTIEIRGAFEHNLKGIDVSIERGALTVVTGVSGSGKSSLAFDTVLAEAQRRFFYTLSHYSRQFLDLQSRPDVKQITGLSPAISLAQNETFPSRRATVGTLTDLSELLGVLFARFGEQRCPTHDQPTSALSPEQIADNVMSQKSGETVALCAPIAVAKKGVFKKELTAFAERGYLRAYIDGKVVPLAPLPVLARDEKHTIKLVIDTIKIKDGSRARLLRSIETALSEGDGFGEFYPCSSTFALDLEGGGAFSAKSGCPVCGFSWPRLDSRHFSANSLGKCGECDGMGEGAGGLSDEEDGEDDLLVRERIGLNEPCKACNGTGLDAQLRAIRLGGRTPQQLHASPMAELKAFLDAQSTGPGEKNLALRRVADEARQGAGRIDAIGLGYLTCSRRIRSLSGGEAQRLKLAGILAENLRGVLYVLDEPSQGLHPTEIDTLAGALKKLRDSGNTVIAVDHDEALMRHADWIIDLGPGGGARGGKLMAKFKPAEAELFVRQSVTARHLAHTAPGRLGTGRTLKGNEPALVIHGANLHNLRVETVRFPLAAMTVVAGVSGAGKSSLVLSTLYANAAALVAKGAGKLKPRHAKALAGFEQLTSATLIDRRPVAKSSVSMPASYLDILGHLRDLYASLPDAQVLGLTARHFSLHVEAGRCPECKGRGVLSLKMRFLADARVKCPLCNGQRYQGNVLSVKYLGLSINEVLELTLDEAAEHFKNHRKVIQRLSPALQLGLGYLKLGQPSASLSGGEAQRLKLVPHLSSKHGKGSLIVLDEPTTGLHFEDVERLLDVLRLLIANGATVVMVEHNADVIDAADWLVELGPGSAENGGKLQKQASPRR